MSVNRGLMLGVVMLCCRGKATDEIFEGSCVRLLADKTAFRDSFARFGTDPVRGLTEAKLAWVGQQARIAATFADRTARCVNADGEAIDFPVESFEAVETCQAAASLQDHAATTDDDVEAVDLPIDANITLIFTDGRAVEVVLFRHELKNITHAVEEYCYHNFLNHIPLEDGCITPVLREVCRFRNIPKAAKTALAARNCMLFPHADHGEFHGRGTNNISVLRLHRPERAYCFEATGSTVLPRTWAGRVLIRDAFGSTYAVGSDGEPFPVPGEEPFQQAPHTAAHGYPKVNPAEPERAEDPPAAQSGTLLASQAAVFSRIAASADCAETCQEILHQAALEMASGFGPVSCLASR